MEDLTPLGMHNTIRSKLPIQTILTTMYLSQESPQNTEPRNMKQQQSGHAVKGQAYGCSHINEVRVTELTKTGVTVNGERPAAA